MDKDQTPEDLFEQFITSLPEERQQSMRARQWRLDQELDKCANLQERLDLLAKMSTDNVKRIEQVRSSIGTMKAEIIPINRSRD